MTTENKTKLKKPIRLFIGILVFALGFLVPIIKISIMENGVYREGGLEEILPDSLGWLKYAAFIALVITGFALMVTSYQKADQEGNNFRN